MSNVRFYGAINFIRIYLISAVAKTKTVYLTYYCIRWLFGLDIPVINWSLLWWW